MTYNITLIPGDGIGPEITEATKRVLEATGIGFGWDVVYAGAHVQEEYGTPLPEHVLESIRKNKVAIKGPVTTPVGSGFRSVNVAMRKKLHLYACRIHSRSDQLYRVFYAAWIKSRPHLHGHLLRCQC